MSAPHEPGEPGAGKPRYTLIGPDGRTFRTDTPGTLGGYRRRKIYGRLDCPSARHWIQAGHYVRHRVFFLDEGTAIAAGYRPCAICLPEQYSRWKGRPEQFGPDSGEGE